MSSPGGPAPSIRPAPRSGARAVGAICAAAAHRADAGRPALRSCIEERAPDAPPTSSANAAVVPRSTLQSPDHATSPREMELPPGASLKQPPAPHIVEPPASVPSQQLLDDDEALRRAHVKTEPEPSLPRGSVRSRCRRATCICPCSRRRASCRRSRSRHRRASRFCARARRASAERAAGVVAQVVARGRARGARGRVPRRGRRVRRSAARRADQARRGRAGRGAQRRRGDRRLRRCALDHRRRAVVCARLVDAPAYRVTRGAVVVSRGTLAEARRAARRGRRGGRARRRVGSGHDRSRPRPVPLDPRRAPRARRSRAGARLRHDRPARRRRRGSAQRAPRSADGARRRTERGPRRARRARARHARRRRHGRGRRRRRRDAPR